MTYIEVQRFRHISYFLAPFPPFGAGVPFPFSFSSFSFGDGDLSFPPFPPFFVLDGGGGFTASSLSFLFFSYTRIYTYIYIYRTSIYIFIYNYNSCIKSLLLDFLFSLFILQFYLLFLPFFLLPFQFLILNSLLEFNSLLYFPTYFDRFKATIFSGI